MNKSLSFMTSVQVQSVSSFDPGEDLTRFLPARPGDTIRDERTSPPITFAIHSPGFPRRLFGKARPPSDAELFFGKIPADQPGRAGARAGYRRYIVIALACGAMVIVLIGAYVVASRNR